MAWFIIVVGILLIATLWAIFRPTPVYLFAFRSAGKEFKLHVLQQQQPLLYAGHVGVSFDGAIIYGFTPHAPEYQTHAELEVLLQLLRMRVVFSGTVNDDTAVFHAAQDLADMHHARSNVYVLIRLLPWYRTQQLKRAIAVDMQNSPLEEKRYRLPLLVEANQDEVCYNCATYLVTLGITLPESTGVLSKFVPAMIAQGGFPWQR
jgi:hypothetical protein